MCLAIPGQIIKIESRKATVKYPQAIHQAILTDENFQVGDWVMVQMGLVVKKISTLEANKARQSWQNQ